MSDCVFCGLIEKKANLLYEDDVLVVMLSPQPFVAGHVLVMPKTHAPIVEKVPDDVVGKLFAAVNKVGIAVFEALQAHGTNVLVQNGLAAGQKHNHAMIHVLPRFENDNVQIGWQPKQADEDSLSTMELKLKEHAQSIGIFKKEKVKPVEMKQPEKAHPEDERVKQLRRMP